MPEAVAPGASPLDQIRRLGLVLPPAPKPVASYVQSVRVGNLLFVSGQLPTREGKPVHTGKVGQAVSLDQAKEAARVAALNALAVVSEALGSLDKVKRIVRTVGNVAAAPGFTDVHLVNNGASDLLFQVFGDKGRHARLSIGVAELPLNVPFEFELICEVA